MAKRKSRRRKSRTAKHTAAPRGSQWTGPLVGLMVALVINFFLFNLIVGYVENNLNRSAFLYSVRDAVADSIQEGSGAHVATVTEEPLNRSLPTNLWDDQNYPPLNTNLVKVEVVADSDTGEIMKRFYMAPEVFDEILKQANTDSQFAYQVVQKVPEKGYYVHGQIAQLNPQSFDDFLAGRQDWPVDSNLVQEAKLDGFRSSVQSLYEIRQKKIHADYGLTRMINILGFASAAALVIFFFGDVLWFYLMVFFWGTVDKILLYLLIVLHAGDRALGFLLALSPKRATATEGLLDETPPPPPSGMGLITRRVRTMQEDIQDRTAPLGVPPKYKYSKYERQYDNLLEEIRNRLDLVRKAQADDAETAQQVQLIIRELELAIKTAEDMKSAADSLYDLGNYKPALAAVQEAIDYLRAI